MTTEQNSTLDDMWHLHRPTEGAVGINALREVATETESPGLKESGVGFGSQEIRIALIDTGFDVFEGGAEPRGHPDLDGVFDLHLGVDLDTEPRPVLWDSGRLIAALRNIFDAHGTAIAGIVAGKRTGIAPNCRIVPIRASTNFSPKDLAGAIRHAADNADVLLLARSLPDPDRVEEPTSSSDLAIEDHEKRKVELEELNQALVEAAKRMPVICGSGNAGGDVPIYPARLAETITVGACNDKGYRATYSQYGEGLDLVAPSSDLPMVNEEIDRAEESQRLGARAIMTTDIAGPLGYTDGDYCLAQGTFAFGGTSAAAAQVAAVVGLMLSVNPELSPTRVRDLHSASGRPRRPDAECESRTLADEGARDPARGGKSRPSQDGR